MYVLLVTPTPTRALSYPDPTESDLKDPAFNAIWAAIKGWDISREPAATYSGTTGNDVMRILLELRALATNVEHSGYLKRQREEGDAIWAVRVLDRYQELNPDAHAFATCYLPDLPIPARKWKCVSFSHPGMFFGPDPEAARIAAAIALTAADSSLPQRREGTT